MFDPQNLVEPYFRAGSPIGANIPLYYLTYENPYQQGCRGKNKHGAPLDVLGFSVPVSEREIKIWPSEDKVSKCVTLLKWIDHPKQL